MMGQTNLQDLFRQAMGNYPTGVTVITTEGQDGSPVGMTVNSFASVSMDPTLILWSIDHNVSTYEHFINNEEFAVHILAGDQADVCVDFTKKGDRFANVEWTRSSSNIPLIQDVAAVLECGTFKRVEAGDHTIIIGEVNNIQVEEKDPLLYHRRQFDAIPESFYKSHSLT